LPLDIHRQIRWPFKPASTEKRTYATILDDYQARRKPLGIAKEAKAHRAVAKKKPRSKSP
jgi:hypothetical protein